MPEIYPVTANLFPGLLERLGVRLTQPRAPLWYLADTIMPVSLVDSQITLQAIVETTAQQFATEGEKTAPAGGTILASTGQLVAGTFNFTVYGTFIDTVTDNGMTIGHRDPTDVSNNWLFTYRGASGNDPTSFRYDWTETVLENERIRVTTAVLGGAGSLFNAIIWRRLLS